MNEMDFERWMMQCGVGERYWDSSDDRLRESTEIIAYMEQLPENIRQGRGLLILGPLGVGKTSALALIARSCYQSGYKCWYTTVTKLIQHLLRASGMKTVQQAYGMERGQPYQVDPKIWPLLLLDEFGSAYENPYAMAAFEDYIGWRYDHKLATCVAANLTAQALRENAHYARMVDRWRETSTVIQVGGKSMRRDQSEIAAERGAGGE